MNINLFKKKNVVSVESLTQTFVTQNELKEIRMMMRQLNKKIEEKNETIEKKNTVVPLLKSLKEINYTFRKEPMMISVPNQVEIQVASPIIKPAESSTITTLDISDEKKELAIPHITPTELEEKSKSIIEEIHKHIQDVNQYNYTINGYLFQQLRDRIEEQDRLIHDLYEKLEKN